MVNRQDNIFDTTLSDIEQAVLAELQAGIALTACPYNELANKLGISQDEIFGIIRNLFQKNILREISPVFNAAGLGYASTLVAVSVLPSVLPDFIDFLDKQPGISHNYGRRHQLNVWFTLAMPDPQRIRAKVFDPFLAELKMRFNLDEIINLPVVRMFKLNVRFGHPAQTATTKSGSHIHTLTAGNSLSEREKSLVRILQAGIPTSVRPFADLAQMAKLARLSPPVTEPEILETLQLWQRNSVLRRVSGRVRHYNMGYTYNAMMVFAPEPDCINQIGQKIADMAFVSHCYHRQRNEIWNYDLYAMVHATSESELNDNIKILTELADKSDFQVLNTQCEYKKQAVRYFE